MAINFNNYSIEDGINLEENDRGLVTPYIAFRNRFHKTGSFHMVTYFLFKC